MDCFGVSGVSVLEMLNLDACLLTQVILKRQVYIFHSLVIP